MGNLSIIASISVSSANLHLYSNGVIHIDIQVSHAFTLSDAQEIVETRLRLSKGKKHPLLFTSKFPFVTPSKDVMDYLTTPERTSQILADAFVISSFSQRLSAKTYYFLKKPDKPTRLFSSKEKAMKWLSTFV